MKKLLILSFLLFPTLVLALDYTPIVGIPGVDTTSTGVIVGGMDTLINALYALSIGIAALLAVIKIIIGGVKWMLTDIVTQKSEAKKDITGALLGLLVVLGAVLILNVINPELSKVSLNLRPVEIPVFSAADGVTALITGNIDNVGPIEYYNVGSGDLTSEKSIQLLQYAQKCGTEARANDNIAVKYADGRARCISYTKQIKNPDGSIAIRGETVNQVPNEDGPEATCAEGIINAQEVVVRRKGTWYDDPEVDTVAYCIVPN